MDQHLSIEKTGIQGLYVVNPASYKSDEDLIVETYNSQELLKNSLNMTFVQENQSMSVKGVLRGLHVQKNFPQGKLVRVVRGKIYDVAVDTRTTSSTYGDWYGVELSADNKKQFYIPEGFAHGFYVISDIAEVCFKVSDYWHPNDEIGIPWNDPELKINWPIGEYLNSSFHAFTWTTDYVKDMEPLFPLLVLIVTKITGSLYCVQTILELCVILPLYVAVRKDKNTSLGMAMFVFCMAFYNPSMNMMRQSIAMSLGVLGFEYWKNAEKKNAFICVIIAFLFHTSSLLILLIYLLYDYIVKGTTLSITGNNVSKRNETPRMLISMGIGFVVMIMMSAIVSALSAVGFGEYVSYVTGKLVFMPNQLLIRIPQIILIIWSYRYLRKDGEDISFFLVMEVYAVLFSQFTSVSGYGGRIALYFAIFEVLVISQAMSALKPRKSGIIIRPLIIGYYMFYWWYYFVFVGAHQTVPYIFMR